MVIQMLHGDRVLNSIYGCYRCVLHGEICMTTDGRCVTGERDHATCMTLTEADL